MRVVFLAAVAEIWIILYTVHILIQISLYNLIFFCENNFICGLKNYYSETAFIKIVAPSRRLKFLSFQRLPLLVIKNTMGIRGILFPRNS